MRSGLYGFQSLHRVGKLRHHAYQQGGLGVGFSAALFPVF